MSSSAVDCVHYEEHAHTISEAIIMGAGWDVAVSGDYAYVAELDGYLSVVDISHPVSPAVITRLQVPGSLEHLTIAGDRLYLPEGPRLRVIDISNPQSPQIAATVDLPVVAIDVTIVGDRAYVVLGNGLAVVDISQPGSPMLLGTVVTDFEAFAVAVEGSFAYLANGPNGLYVIDVSSPALPVVVGHLPVANWMFTVVADQAHVYIGGRFGVKILGIESPTQPVVLSSMDIDPDVTELVVTGSLLHIAADHNYQIVDISNPSNPITVAILGTHLAKGLAIQGTHAFLAYLRLRIVDISHPESPEPLSSLALTDPYKVAVAGDFAYATDGASIKAIDVGNPTAPAIVGSVNTPALDIAVDGAVGFAVGTVSHRVLDLSDPAHPIARGALASTGGIWDVDLDDHTAYVFSVIGLKIADVTNLNAPTWIAELIIPGEVRGGVVDNGFAYVITASNSLHVIDVSTASSPRIIGALTLPYSPSAVAVSGQHVVVASRGVFVVDVSNPEAPELIGRTAWPRSGYEVAIKDGIAYVASYEFGFQVVDFKNPSIPLIIGELATTGYASGVALTDGAAVVVSQGIGLEVLPLQCPATVMIPDGALSPPTRLLSIWPNPWQAGVDPFVRMGFQIDQGTWVNVVVVDGLGRIVSRLENQWMGAGRNETRWDGRDGGRMPVAAGVYFIRCSSEPGNIVTQRMVLLR